MPFVLWQAFVALLAAARLLFARHGRAETACNLTHSRILQMKQLFVLGQTREQPGLFAASFFLLYKREELLSRVCPCDSLFPKPVGKRSTFRTQGSDRSLVTAGFPRPAGIRAVRAARGWLPSRVSSICASGALTERPPHEAAPCAPSQLKADGPWGCHTTCS